MIDYAEEAVRAAFKGRDRCLFVPQRDGVLVLERSCPEGLKLERHPFDSDKEARAFVWDKVLERARGVAAGE